MLTRRWVLIQKEGFSKSIPYVNAHVGASSFVVGATRPVTFLEGISNNNVSPETCKHEADSLEWTPVLVLKLVASLF